MDSVRASSWAKKVVAAAAMLFGWADAARPPLVQHSARATNARPATGTHLLIAHLRAERACRMGG
jgi:hypothetical protein